jgi:hypothetical protein
MSFDLKNGSDIDSDNIIPVELEDLTEELRLEMELALEEQRKAWLAGLQKTRNGVVKKVATQSVTPSASKPLDDEVTKSTEELVHLIDTSVASKYGNSMHALAKNMTDKFEEFKVQLSKEYGIGLPHHAPSSNQLGTQQIPNNFHVPDASTNAIQPYVATSNSHNGQNLVGSSANTFFPSVAHPTVTTSVPPNHNRSGVLNPNLQQPYYQTVAYNDQPSYTQFGANPQPSYNQFGNASSFPLQTSHTQVSLPENLSRVAIPSTPQINSTPPSMKDQLADILREYGLAPKGTT